MRHQLRLTISLCLLATVAVAADWPTFRHDNGRSGATTESLALPLTPLWTISPRQPPLPSWPNPERERPRTRFDDVFHVAIARSTIFFGSSANGAVYAVDAATGTVRWTFITGGAIRLAPTVWEGRVYVTSDDGSAYCLAAIDGTLLWQRQAAITAQHVIGHGRMISAQPPRAGILVANEVAYFACGIFPTEGVGLFAVDARTGEPKWSNTGFGQMYQRMAHGGTEGFSGASPQGYMLASESKLFVCSGRSVPAAFARSTGKLLYWKGATHHEGGTWALLTENTLYSDADRLLPPNAIAAYYQGTKGLPPIDGTRLKHDSPRLMARDGETGEDRFVAFPGDRIVVTPMVTYTQQGGVITAIDRQAYKTLGARENAIAKKLMKNFWANYKRSLDVRVFADRQRRRQASGQDLNSEDKKTLEAAKKEVAPGWAERDELEQQMRDTKTEIAKIIKWRCQTDLTDEIIVAGDTVYIGGDNKVGAIRAADGQLVWTREVKGRARGLAVANRRLVVSTDSGHIHCFAPEHDADSPAVTPKDVPDPPILPSALGPDSPADELCAGLARAAAKRLGTGRGIGLVYGCEKGALIRELVTQTELYVVGYDPNPQNVHAARQALLTGGYLGSRCAVFQAELDALPCPPYVANLVVSESVARHGRPTGTPQEILRVLRPCGGIALLGQPHGAPMNLSREALETWWGDRHGTQITQGNGLWLTFTAPPLPGTAEWTHQYADSANTGCSGDDLVTAPFALQWFGRPGMAKVVDRHQRAAAPLYANGRLYHQGINYLFGIDAYNGTILWERSVHGAQRKGLANAAGNMCATPDHLLVTVGNHCLIVDGSTGNTLKTIPLPSAESDRQWGWIATVGEQVFGTCGKDTTTAQFLFCLDAASGKPLWRNGVGEVRNASLALAHGQLFFLESQPRSEERQAAEVAVLPMLPADPKPNVPLPSQPYYPSSKTAADIRTVVALDAATGETLWRRPLDLTGMGKGLTLCVSQGIVLVAANLDATRFVALAAEDGTPIWTKKTFYFRRPVIIGDTIYTLPYGHHLKTGALKMRTNPVTGTLTPFVWTKAYGCGGMSASSHTLFFRSGSLAFYDVTQDAGIGNLGGLKPSCWISQIPAGGLWLAPEGSAGCSCSYPIRSSVALRPVTGKQEWWTHYVRGIEVAPVNHLYLNIGAPGDRRDGKGRLWFAWPRPTSGLTLQLPLSSPENADRTLLMHVDGATKAAPGQSWLYGSGSCGPAQLDVTLGKATGEPRCYTVRLHYGVMPESQGKECVVTVGLDHTSDNKGPVTAKVGDSPVTLELLTHADGKLSIRSSSSHGRPLLCGVEIERR